jgi:hypothetical protein
MERESKLHFTGLRSASVLVRGLAIFGVVVVCGIPTLWWACVHSGIEGFWAAGAAGGLCLLGAWLALPCVAWVQDPKRMLAGVFLGMAVRSGVPLGFGIALHLLDPPLAKAGLLYYLVVFYFPLLAVETYLSLPERPKRIKDDD